MKNSHVHQNNRSSNKNKISSAQGLCIFGGLFGGLIVGFNVAHLFGIQFPIQFVLAFLGLCAGIFVAGKLDTKPAVSVDSNNPKSAGKAGEEKVCRFLQQLSIKNTVFNDKNLENKFSDKKAQIDHIVVCPKGIVLIETKYYSGEIDMTNDDQWLQTKPDGTVKACPHAYNQSKRHMRIMFNLLNEYGFTDIKLYSIVVFAHEEAIYKGLENYKYVMKYDSMNEFIESMPNCKAMMNPKRYQEVLEWVDGFEDAHSYDE